mmetsp:Transcript_11225/g.25208  ORF Transcript_11225/g.25208 Transcript_11225/m.25208 type:complete len:310 (-) Transcript_11225:70-999(-)
MAALTLQMEAYAFRELVEHLKWRTDVQNIELMNLAGFCRNCLAKWYHAGAQVYGVPVDYAAACELVYGEPYPSWKAKHQTKASEEQLAVYESSKAKHARTEPQAALLPWGQAPGSKAGGHSNVCGQNCDVEPAPAQALQAPAPGGRSARIGVLTASDRASRGEYEDLSGPAVVASLQAFGESSGQLVPDIVRQQVVADDEAAIGKLLEKWSVAQDCDVIFTTGGTGFGPRDVTPEATKRVLVRHADSLARAMAWSTSFVEPHSVLSRGLVGVTSSGVLVVNLPGNPAAVKQCLAVLLPVLPHALQMLAS